MKNEAKRDIHISSKSSSKEVSVRDELYENFVQSPIPSNEVLSVISISISQLYHERSTA